MARAKVRMTIQLDETWSDNHTTDELREYLHDRFDGAFGFRASVQSLRVKKDSRLVDLNKSK